jgi:murein L,D-transpeptidase YafK
MRRWLRLMLLPLLIAAGIGIAVMQLGEGPSLAESARADRILVEKSARRMTLFWKGAPLKIYRIALGRGEPGPKMQQGDNRTPLGLYRISARNRASAFHLALRVSYPDAKDIERAKKRGVDPGGDIMIHGLPNGLGWIGGLHRLIDWTAGCVAVTNREIEEIWRVVPNGTPIEIRA